MEITFDENKRAKTLEDRGLDFKDADEAFSGFYLQAIDDRRDYGEPRYVRIAEVRGDIVMLVWTPRNGTRRIISMRKCNADEKTLFDKRRLGGS